MSRISLVVATLLFLVTGSLRAEILEDQVILKNGTIVRGQIISLTDTSIHLMTRELRTVTYPREAILRTTREAIPVKNPNKALGLSFIFISGIGQWYNGENLKGWGFFLWSYLSFYIPFSDDSGSSELSGTNKALLGSYAVSMLVGAFDAHRSAKRINRERFGLLYEDGKPRISVHIHPAPNNGIGARLAASF